jgi:hypothetical protein
MTATNAAAAETRTATGHLVLLLDPSARAGRTGYRLRVKDARTHRAQARDALGVGRDDTPTTVDLLRAAAHLSKLLHDATGGDARLVVELGGEHVSPAVVLSTLVSR